MSRRDDLELMREHLMNAMLTCEPSVLAQVVGQLRAVVKELAELPDATTESVVDKVRRERAERRRAAGLKAV